MTDKIQIFQAEKEAGLEHLIEANASIAYEAPALLYQECNEDISCSLNASKNIKELPFVKSFLSLL